MDDHHDRQTIPLLPVSLTLTSLALYLHAHYGLLLPLTLIAFYSSKLALHYAVENGALAIIEDVMRLHGAAIRERYNTVLGVLLLGSGVAALVGRVLRVWWGVLDWIFSGYNIMEEREAFRDDKWEPLLIFDERGGRYERLEGRSGVILVPSPSPQMKLVVYNPATARDAGWIFQ